MSDEKQKLEDLTVKQLRDLAVKRGLPAEDAEKFTSKAPLIATINVLKVKDAKVATLNEVVTPQQAKSDEKRWRTKAIIMRDKLAKQPKVRILLPLEPNQKKGVVKEVMIRGRKETVYVSGTCVYPQLNGYKLVIPKGVYVDVPEQVATLISKAHADTQDAGRDFLIDRIREHFDNIAYSPVKKTIIAGAELGNDAGIYGAASLVING